MLSCACVVLTCLLSCVLGARTCVSNQQVDLSKASLTIRDNLWTYTSQLLRESQTFRQSPMKNKAFSAYGIADILMAMIFLSGQHDSLRLANSHPLFANVRLRQFSGALIRLRLAVETQRCKKDGSHQQTSETRLPLSLTEVFKRSPLTNVFDPEDPDSERWNWDVLHTNQRLADSKGQGGTNLNAMLSGGKHTDVYRILRENTQGPRESLVLMNVANLRAYWKVPFAKTDAMLAFQGFREKATKVEAMYASGLFRYRLNNKDSVKLYATELPDLLEIPLIAQSGEEFRLTIFQSTKTLSVIAIQRQFANNCKRWKKMLSGRPLRKASIMMPTINITSMVDFSKTMLSKSIPTHIKTNYDDPYSPPHVLSATTEVKHNITRLLSVSQITIDENGISTDISPQPTPLRTFSKETSGLVVKINTPFVYSIEHVPSSTLVSAGRVATTGSQVG